MPAFSRFFIIDDFDLKKGPKDLPIKKPRLEENLNPKNLNIQNKILININ